MTTAALWHRMVEHWTARLPDGGSLGDWLFSPDHDHRRRLTTSHLAHSFFALRTAAGIRNVTLHQLRHSVATFLVDRGAEADCRLTNADIASRPDGCVRNGTSIALRSVTSRVFEDARYRMPSERPVPGR